MKTYEEFRREMQKLLDDCKPWTAMPDGYEGNVLYALYRLLNESKENNFLGD